MLTNPPRVAAALSLALALLLPALVGCGSGGEEEAATEAPPAAVPVANQGAAVEGPAFNALVGQQLAPGEMTPAVVKDALAQKRPVVVLFYVTGGHDDGLVRETLQKLGPKYEDVVIATYDFKAPAEFGDLARLLRVDYPPQLVFIDTNGVIRSVLSGYVDEGTLNQHLVNIRQA